ncbi:MAG: hypothetical protein JXQ76_00760 [Campylobacterales bacterium]|nr:hypothetical protein [Campylobacterales bacterium]
MRRGIAVYILSLSIVGAITVLWYLSYPLHCFSIIAPFMALAFISFSFIEIKIVNKNCFNRCYLKEGTLLYTIFSSKILLTLWYTLVAMVFTFSLFIEMLFYSATLKLYLIFHIFLMGLIYLLIKRSIKDLVHIDAILAREWSINIGMVLLFGAFIYITLHSYTPAFIDDSLEKSIINASQEVGSHCKVIDNIVRLKAEFNGAFWWIVENTTEHIHHKMTKWGIWLGFILMNAFALLGINRLVVTVIDVIDRSLKR